MLIPTLGFVVGEDEAGISVGPVDGESLVGEMDGETGEGARDGVPEGVSLGIDVSGDFVGRV